MVFFNHSTLSKLLVFTMENLKKIVWVPLVQNIIKTFMYTNFIYHVFRDIMKIVHRDWIM